MSQDVVLALMLWSGDIGSFWPYGDGVMRNLASGFPRLYLPRTPVNSLQKHGQATPLYLDRFVRRVTSGYGPSTTRRILTLFERVGVAAGAGICGATIAAAGSYTFLYGLAYQFYPLPGGTVNSGAGGTLTVLFLLLAAIGMSVAGGALVSKALGVSTWQRSTLISVMAHAIGIPLWIVAWNYLDSYPVSHPPVFPYDQPLRSFSAATYAFVVPLVVVFSSYRRDAPGGLAVAIFLAVATATLPMASVLMDSDELALASGAVAWVMLPAISVLGAAIIGPRGH